jgi:hypothetical protein
MMCTWFSSNNHSRQIQLLGPIIDMASLFGTTINECMLKIQPQYNKKRVPVNMMEVDPLPHKDGQLVHWILCYNIHCHLSQQPNEELPAFVLLLMSGTVIA